MKKKMHILFLAVLLLYGFSQTFDEIVITDNGSIVFTDCAILSKNEIGDYYWLDLLPELDSGRLALGTHETPWKYIWLHSDEYLRLASNTLIDIVSANGDIEIEAGDDIYISAGQTSSSQVYIDLPMKNGGDEKVRCALWFCPVTNTLKASPVEPIAWEDMFENFMEQF